MTSLSNGLLAAVLGAIFTEIAGYFLHILLHSEKIPWLSRNHMIHHLRIYGPKRGLRSGDTYRGSVDGRSSLLGIGLEWLGPVIILVALTAGLSRFLAIPFALYLCFITSALLWGYFVFGAMHDAMHLTHFWMEQIPLLRTWFLRIRRLHDIHHLHFSPEGRLNSNFGICFFMMDRLMGTRVLHHTAFNQAGFEAAERRYANLLKSN